MTTKHTPGPWAAKLCSHGNEWAARVVAEGGSVIAAVTNTDSETNAPTAALIAAAPDLLAACVAAVSQLEQVPVKKGTSGVGDHADEAMTILLAAIEKARGAC